MSSICKKIIRKIIILAMTVIFMISGIQVSASENTVSMGSAGISFEKGITYIVPVSMKNAAALNSNSAAAGCLGKYARLKILEDGSASVLLDLRSVTMGSLKDYAYNFKVYQGDSIKSETVDAEVVSTQKGTDGQKDVPKEIRFTIPEATKSNDGVFVNMFVDSMGAAPNAYIKFDYASAKPAGNETFNFTKTGTALVEQFGKYYVDADVTVTDGVISNIEIAGRDFKGTYADDNPIYLNRAIKGMKDKFLGLYDTDTDEVSKVDIVSGATSSSKAIKTAVMNALGMEIQEEVVSEPPKSVPKAGIYSISIKNRTDIVDHSLIENETAKATLTVDAQGKMTLSYKMISGTIKEPLYVLGFNGYYANNDFSSEANLTKTGAEYKEERCDGYQVVTDVKIPLSSLEKYYYTNVYLYVPVMSNLNGEQAGVVFENGKFNIKSTIIMDWSTLKKEGDYIPPTTSDVTVKAPTVPQSVKAASASYNKVKVSWKKVSGATGYEVYQYNAKTKKYSKIATVKAASYTKSGLTTGTGYSFKVRAYTTKSGKTAYSGYSKAVSAKPALSKVTGVKARNSAKNTVKVTWKKTEGATGYKVYRATKKKGKYQLVKTISKNKTVAYTNKKLKKGKKYYYKVRAYKKVGKKIVYGSYSSIVSVKVKK